MEQQHIVLADDGIERPSTGTSLSLMPGGNSAYPTRLEDNHQVSLVGDGDAPGSLSLQNVMMSSAARSPIAIAVGAGVAGWIGYKHILPRAMRRYGKGAKSYALTGAAALIIGVVTHGATSYALYKWGPR